MASDDAIQSRRAETEHVALDCFANAGVRSQKRLGGSKGTGDFYLRLIFFFPCPTAK